MGKAAVFTPLGSSVRNCSPISSLLLDPTYGVARATVAANSATGIARVQVGGTWSNSVAFSVNTASISSISPTNGLPGTTVTINGSGFGSAQGNGQLTLGTTNGVVQNWTDSQIIALVGT